MFTVIQNYKSLIMMCLANNMAAEKLTIAIDADSDGDVDMVDINRFDADSQAAIRRVLGNANMNILEQGNRFSVQSLIENGFIVERATTIADSTGVRESHRTNVESSRILPMERSTFQRRIERGSRGEDVRALQNFLLQNGFNPNGVDGSFGNGTRRALMDYQSSNGLPVSGILHAGERESSQTLNHMLGIDSGSSQTSPEAADEGSDVQTSVIQYPPRGREATIALQRLIGTPADGAFGPASRRALQSFLQSRGLYNGAIDGIIGNGSIAAINAYNTGGTTTVEAATPDRTVARGREAMNSRDIREVNAFVEALDRSLDAGALRNSRIRSLAQDISRMSETGVLDSSVWNEFIATLTSLGWEDFVTRVQAADFTDAQKYDLLTRGIGENTMGGVEMSEQLQPGNTIASIAAYEAENRNLNQMAQILSQSTGIPVATILSARQSWLSQAANAGFSSRNFTEGEAWSTRSQGISNITGTQQFRSHKIIDLPGSRDYVNMGISAPQLIREMTNYSLEDIRDSLGAVRNRVTVDEIREALLTGEAIVEGNTTIAITYDTVFFKSADCFNDAVGVIPRVQISTESDSDGDDGITTTPGGGVDPSTTPGGGVTDGPDTGDAIEAADDPDTETTTGEF